MIHAQQMQHSMQHQNAHLVEARMTELARLRENLIEGAAALRTRRRPVKLGSNVVPLRKAA